MRFMSTRPWGWLPLAGLVFLLSCDRQRSPVEPLPQAAALVGPVLVINEVMADPSAVADDNGEWIEVHNAGDAAVNLQGWTLVSNNDAAHTIANSVTVAAGGYAVLARVGAKNRNGGVTANYTYGTGINLANGADWVALRNAGSTVDSVAWSAAPAGASRGVKDPMQDNTDVGGTNWSTQTSVFGKGDKGTPGKVNNGYVAPVGPIATVTVSPATASIVSGTTQQFSATARDANGNIVATTFTWSSSNSSIATVDAGGLAAGVAAGSAQIRASAPNGVMGEAALTVTSSGGGDPGSELVVRFLDIGQGDATYITNGTSKIFIDGGENMTAFAAHLDALGLNNTTIDVVIISHAHFDHYNGIRELFKSARGITIRYLFENKDAGTQVSLADLRDSINARVSRGQLIYRDTDDPCVNGQPVCTITLNGGAKLHVLRPNPSGSTPNNRSAAVKLVGPDSASFSMWFAGDAEREAIAWFDTGANYDVAPGMNVDVLKSDHHGSCNGVSSAYLDRLTPAWALMGVGATNTFGHIHTQTKDLLRGRNIPWYRTDQNGTITIRSPGTPGGGYTITPSRGSASMDGAPDATSAQTTCQTM